MLGKILTALLLLFSVVVVLFGGNILIYRISNIKTETMNGTTSYLDNKFGYSFAYPSSWERNNCTLFEQGCVEVISNKDPQVKASIWYSDSDKINNSNELLEFVKDDARYAEENQGAKISNIKIENINGMEAVSLEATSPSENGSYYTKQYYFADYNPLPDQVIYIWKVFFIIENNKTTSEQASLNKILNSFKIRADISP